MKSSVAIAVFGAYNPQAARHGLFDIRLRTRSSIFSAKRPWSGRSSIWLPEEVFRIFVADGTQVSFLSARREIGGSAFCFAMEANHKYISYIKSVDSPTSSMPIAELQEGVEL